MASELPFWYSEFLTEEGIMTLDPLFFAGLTIAIGGAVLGILIVRKTKRWVEKG